MSTELLEPPVRENGYHVPRISDQLERSLIQILKLLADETRLKILLSLAREGELHVSAPVSYTHLTLPTNREV